MRFADALDRSAEDIVRPPNLPLGDYIWQIQKVEQREVTDTLESLRFTCICAGATDSVMPDELEEYGKVVGVLVNKDFLFNTSPDEAVRFEQTMFNLKRFFGHCGIDISKGSPKVWLADCVNTQFMGEIRHRPDKNDPEIVYQEINKTAPTA